MSEHTYISDYFGLRYQFPAEVELREDFFSGQEDASRRSFLLFAASGASRVVGYADTVVIMADNATAAHIADPEAYIRKLTTEQLRQQSFEPQGAPQSLTIAGHRFARAEFRKQNTFQTVAVTLLRGYAVTFMFIAPSQPELDSLVRSLQSIQLEAPATAAGRDRSPNALPVPSR